MIKVYIITTGSYSDYRIVAAVKNEKVGQEIIAKLNGPGWEEYALEEHNLITSVDQVYKSHIHTVGVDMNGVEIRHFDHDISGVGEDPYKEDSVHYFPTYYGNAKDKNYKGMVQATSPRGYEVALKAARDKLMQIRAEAEL